MEYWIKQKKIKLKRLHYEHTAIGYKYRMSNVCAGIGRGQMTVLDAHIAHHKHVQACWTRRWNVVRCVSRCISSRCI